MADFRRWFTVLAVLALMVGAASAQVGTATPGGSANNALICTATGAGIPELRPEGYTELAGDILITCTGGPDLVPGAAVPTTNITVYMAPAVPITSRYMNSNGASEALLIIDEAGANVNTGVAGNYGPKAPQSLCSSSAQQQSGGSPCNAVVGVDNGTGSGPYEVSITPASAAPGNGYQFGVAAQNVYQGKIGDFGSNSVTFYNVPVLPPATTGVTRVFRITNIRVPVPGGNLSGTLQAIISTSPSAALPVSGTAINIGVVGPAMSAAVKLATKVGGTATSANPFQQCIGQGPSSTTVALTANLIYTEGFATGFKTRVVPGGASNGLPGNSTGNTLWAAEQTNTAPPSNQNIPGGLYGGFAANSESGFIYPGLTATNGSGSAAVGYTAGLADYGTRLKAVFYNIPAGLNLWVSQTSAVPTTGAFIAGGTSVLPYAVLVASNSGEATADSFNSSGAFSSEIGFSTNSKGAEIYGTDGLPAVQLSANSAGAATAVWEVTNSNPSAQDVLTFSVYISYSPTAPSSTNQYGTPLTTLPTNLPANDVQLSFAPEPGGGTFSTTNATQGQFPTPRFAVIKTQEGAFVQISLCQTTLLYPFVTGAAGFDTGIAVANTSLDPWGTTNQSGSCTLYAYGVTVGTSGNTPFVPGQKCGSQTGSVCGCDTIANPLPGTNCFPIVPAGQVMSVMASQTLTNFQGYVIAVCNFWFAHGYAAVTDLGLRNLWSSYLALEMSTPQSIACSGGNGTSGVTCNLTGGVGSGQRAAGPTTVEQLVH